MKLAVSIDADIHAQVVDAARIDGVSISAARRALLIRDGLAAVAEWEADHGALTDRELEAVRARLERKAPRPRKRSKR